MLSEREVCGCFRRSIDLVGADDEDGLREFVIAAFGQRRKQIVRVLRQVAQIDATVAGAALENAGISASRRPETLSPSEFSALYAQLRSLRKPT